MKTLARILLVLALISGLASCHDRLGRKLIKNDAKPASTPAVVARATPSPTPEATPEPKAAVVVDKSAQVVVFCYHRFEDKPHDGLAISPADFEKQMVALKQQGIVPISMQDFLAWRRGEKSIPAKSALITIDDGYNSSYHIAWPILKKLGYPLTMFVYTKYINVGGKSITWDQLAEMRDAGVEIGSHTVSHADLRAHKGKTPEAYEAWLKDELLGSKQQIEKQLAIKVSTIAFPYGLSNDEVRKKCKEFGYEALFTVAGAKIGYTTPLESVGRYAIESNKPQIFALAANFGSGGGPLPVSAMASAMSAESGAASSSMPTKPAEGETVADPKPVLALDVAGLGAIDPKTVEMRVSGIGVVPAKYDPAAKTISYKPSQSLRGDSCSVIVSANASGKKFQTRWTFRLKQEQEL